MEWLGLPVREKYKDLDVQGLPLNHAYVIVNTTVDNVGVYGVKDDCFNCPYRLEKHLKAGEETSWEVDTSVQRTWRIMLSDSFDYSARNNKRGLLCIMRPTFHEFGVYRLDVGRCVVRPEVAPVNTYLPLILCSLTLLSGCFIYSLAKCLYKHRKNQAKSEKEEKNSENNDTCITINESVDNGSTLQVFRGLLLSFIIFITTGGGGYPIFNNEWGGLNFAECLYFGYVWSVGVNIPTVLDRVMTKKTKCSIIRDVFVKAAVLILLGTVIDSAVERQRRGTYVTLWCPLQRLGLAYFMIATAYVLTVQKFEMKSKKFVCKAITNIVALLWCWIISGFLLAIIIILMSTFISLNCLSNVSFENQRADLSDILTDVSQNCNNGLTEYINKIFVAEPKKATDVNGYWGFSRGLMGIMSTIMHTMVGLKAGIIFLNHQSHTDRLKLWIFWAALFSAGGVIFAVVSYPLDFNLWPISTILLIPSLALYVFMGVYICTAIWGFTSSILTSAGVTSLIVLCGHLLFSKSLPFDWEMSFDSHILYLLQNLWTVLLWLSLSVLLMRKKVEFDI